MKKNFFTYFLNDICKYMEQAEELKIKKIFSSMLTNFNDNDLLKFYFHFEKMIKRNSYLNHIFNVCLFEWFFIYGDKKQWLNSKMNELTNNLYGKEIKQIINSIEEKNLFTTIDDSRQIIDILFEEFEENHDLKITFQKIYDEEIV